MFVGNALGFDMIGDMVADRSGYDTVLYAIAELLEMLGIVQFIYALLSHFAKETDGLVLRLSPPEGGPGSAP